MEMSKRKMNIKNLSDKYAEERLKWKLKSAFFHEQDHQYLSFLIPKNKKILDIGCGTGDTLASLHPKSGVGVDFSERMIEQARENHSDHTFHIIDIEDDNHADLIKDKFDYILISDTVGSFDDCQKTLSGLHRYCSRDTRIIISYYSYFWEPVLKLAELCGIKMPQAQQNYLSTSDIVNFLSLADYDVVGCDWRQLLPLKIMGLGTFINKYIATLPLIRRFCLRNYVVARSKLNYEKSINSCSVIIPCKNEKGNIEPAINRIPKFCDELEIIFVEGHSSDGTYEEIERLIEQYPSQNIKLLKQDGAGKANATYTGFDNANNDVLMILDADLTVPPEELDKFWSAIVSGKGEYIQGTRLVYPMEGEAMRFLNLMANWMFSKIFSWLLNQRFTDTLCGTKVLLRSDYERIKEVKHLLEGKDPFGDFDLLFCSSKLNLKMIEIPVFYRARSYGSTQISRFRNGWELLILTYWGFKKLKAF